MYVKISNYPNVWIRCKIYDRYMEKKYGYDWNHNETKFEKFLEKVESIVQEIYNKTINKVISKRKRKIKVRIDSHDLWSMYSTLAYIIEPMLKKMKESKHGSPHVDDEDVPENLRSVNAAPKENDYDTDEFWHDRWEYVIDQMIWSFEQINTDWESQYYSGNSDWDIVDSKLVEGPNHTFTVDRENQKKHQDRIDNGLRLFAKYYMCLWN